MNKHEEYELGEDVTVLAQPKIRRGTAVLSVRFTTDEIKEIEKASGLEGKTVSQVIREAVQTYLHHRRNTPVFTFSWAACTVTHGAEPFQSKGVRPVWFESEDLVTVPFESAINSKTSPDEPQRVLGNRLG